MRPFRYSTSGRWFKGNTHIHSSASDGGKTFSELAELYASAGYDFLFRTDHWVASDAAADTTSYPLLWMDGIELDNDHESGSAFHVVCLGKVQGVCRDDGLDSALRRAKAQGALTVLAHPHLSGNSLEDCLRREFDGVEVYNHVSCWLNGKSGGLVHWDAALMSNPHTLAFAADDAHLQLEHPGWNGGWIVVNAEACTPEAIIGAIRQGTFYSSCGPELRSIALDEDLLTVHTSPVQFARLVGPGWNGLRLGSFEGPPFDTIRFHVPRDWRYVYLEVEDAAGRRAWTNSLFLMPMEGKVLP